MISLPKIHERVKSLAAAQSADIAERLRSEGVTLIAGRGELVDSVPGMAQHSIKVTADDGTTSVLQADVVLIATGASPRVLPGAKPDGERILNWRQLYDLDTLPEHLVVVGSGVTGAEFVNAYTELGVTVTVVASRDQILPHEDSDAAAVLEDALLERGVTLVKNARADSVTRTADGVLVTMTDGRTVEGSHALMTVGSVPNTTGLGLERVGIELGPGDYLTVDRVSRTSVSGIYAAGDCTGLCCWPRWPPCRAASRCTTRWARDSARSGCARSRRPCSPARRSPRSACRRPRSTTVSVPARTLMLPLNTNARAKMSNLRRGFVKIFCRPATGVVIGGVVVAPIASELILPIALAVQDGLPVDELAETFSVYPSLSGSITEAGRRLMAHDDLD